jgi:hypothetical protein
MTERVLYTPSGSAKVLGFCTEWSRQLFRKGAIPTVARLSDGTPLTDAESLAAVAEERAQRPRRGQRRAG